MTSLRDAEDRRTSAVQLSDVSSTSSFLSDDDVLVVDSLSGDEEPDHQGSDDEDQETWPVAVDNVMGGGEFPAVRIADVSSVSAADIELRRQFAVSPDHQHSLEQGLLNEEEEEDAFELLLLQQTTAEKEFNASDTQSSDEPIALKPCRVMLNRLRPSNTVQQDTRAATMNEPTATDRQRNSQDVRDGERSDGKCPGVFASNVFPLEHSAQVCGSLETVAESGVNEATTEACITKRHLADVSVNGATESRDHSECRFPPAREKKSAELQSDSVTPPLFGDTGRYDTTPVTKSFPSSSERKVRKHLPSQEPATSCVGSDHPTKRRRQPGTFWNLRKQNKSIKPKRSVEERRYAFRMKKRKQRDRSSRGSDSSRDIGAVKTVSEDQCESSLETRQRLKRKRKSKGATPAVRRKKTKSGIPDKTDNVVTWAVTPVTEQLVPSDAKRVDVDAELAESSSCSAADCEEFSPQDGAVCYSQSTAVCGSDDDPDVGHGGLVKRRAPLIVKFRRQSPSIVTSSCPGDDVMRQVADEVRRVRRHLDLVWPQRRRRRHGNASSSSSSLSRQRIIVISSIIVVVVVVIATHRHHHQLGPVVRQS